MKKKTIILDSIVLFIYVLAANPAITGVPVHEWLGIGALFILIFHCALHYDWFALSFTRLFKYKLIKGCGRLLLNVLTGVTLALCCVSGICISGTVLAACGLYADGYFFWNPMHSFSAKLLLALILVHGALNASRIYTTLVKRGRKEDCRE